MTTQFALQLIYAVDMSFSRTRVGLVTFSTDARLMFYLNSFLDKESLINSMRFVYKGGRTNIHDALQMVNNEVMVFQRGDRPLVQDIMVLVSDGKANINEADTTTESDAFKSRGGQIYTVALGTSPNFRLIDEMSSLPSSDYVLRLRNVGEVSQTLQDLLEQICR